MYDENSDWRERILGALRELKEDYRREGQEGGESAKGSGERGGDRARRAPRAATSA